MAGDEAGRRAFRIPPREASEPVAHPEPDPFGWRCRAWCADEYHWRRESELPGGEVSIAASNGRGRWPVGGPSGSGLVWERRVGGGNRADDDPWWIGVALHSYWTFCPLVTDAMAGISHELSRLDRARRRGRGGERCASWECRARGGIGAETPTL